MMKDKYGRGSAAANGEGFVDLSPGDTFSALEEQLKKRIADRFDNAMLGISASIGSKRNASELAKHLASGEEEEAHKFAAKNIGALFARGQLALSHKDKKAVAGQRWITRFIRVFVPFFFAGDDYLATLTLKDVDPDKRIYAVEAVEINQDVKSRSTPRGAISEDLNSAPFQDLTSQLTDRIAYYVGDVNRTHPKFIGRAEPFSIGRTAELLEEQMHPIANHHSQADNNQAPSNRHLAPKFSIITPCYKCAKYVRETLDSVLAQKVADWELICVDDGSPDETGKVLDDYLREHCAAVTESERVIKAIGDEDRHPDAPKRILASELSSGAQMTVVHQQNCGVSGARNTALTLATGEWIVLLDGDDLLAPEALFTISECIGSGVGIDVIEGASVEFDDMRAPVWKHGKSGICAIDVSTAIPHAPFSGCFQRFVFRRELVKDVAFKGVSCSEEMGYLVKGFVRAKKLIRTGAEIYGYRIVNGSMSHRRGSYRLCEDYFDLVRHVTKLLATSEKRVDRSDARSILNRWYERHVYDIFNLENRDDRRAAWSRWLRELPKMLRYKNLSTWWQRFVVRTCLVLRLKCVAFLLCYLPHWLKRKGLHR